MHKLYLTCCAVLISVAVFAKENIKARKSQYGFIENKGQIIDQYNQLNPAVLYLWNGGGMNVHLKANSFSYEVRKVSSSKYQVARRSRFDRSHKVIDDSTTICTHRVDVQLVGANEHPAIIAEEKSKDYINYYTTGTPEEGATLVHHYSKVTYKDIYPHIDIEFIVPTREGARNTSLPLGGRAWDGAFKYNFIVRPGGNVDDIRLKYKGANGVVLNDGDLVVATAYGDVIEEIPLSYEVESGNVVTVSYKDLGNGVYGFEPSTFNEQQTLVIDPWVSYFGGSGEDEASDITTDGLGNIITTGVTGSSSNIATSGVHQSIIAGPGDAFIVKFNALGAIQWATYYGGNWTEWGQGVATDGANNIIVTGSTGSSNNIATAGAHQTAFGSITSNTFVAKFDAAGNRLWGTYYGGSAGGESFAVATDANGNIIVGGVVWDNGGDIATVGAHQTTMGGGEEDAFIVKFNSSGTRLWGTYYGGANANFGGAPEIVYSIAVDASGNIFAAGETTSDEGIATLGAHQTAFLSTVGPSCFLVKFDVLGNRVWGTYYGGENLAGSPGVALDLTGNVYLTGSTGSTTGIATPGAYKSNLSLPIVVSGFLVQFNNSGIRQWGTYYCGTGGGTVAVNVCADNYNNVWIAGWTSDTTGMVTSGAYQDSLAASSDGFLAKFDVTGNRIWASYLGGGGVEDNILDVVALPDGSIAFAGYTVSISGLATAGAYQTLHNGGVFDAFIGRLTNEDILTIQLVDIAAANLGSKNRVHWRTASELSTDYFELERSKDGAIFEKLTTISTNGRASTYEWWDKEPFMGTNFYRLRMHEANGTYNYSKVVTATVRTTIPAMSISPNPAHSHLQITIQGNTANGNVDIIDVSSKIVGSWQVPVGKNGMEVDVRHLPAGVYIVQYEDDERKESVKLVKE